MVIVARGHIAAEEIAATTRQLVEANVPAYAKIIDVSQATSELTREQVQKVADLLRGAPGDTSRGPVAFVINPDRVGFAVRRRISASISAPSPRGASVAC